MATVIFDNGIHKCVVFDDLLGGRGDIQSNQFLIIHNNEGLLYDIGGIKVMQPLYKEISKFISPRNIKTIILSHQDPDTGASVNYWMQFTNIKIRTFVSSLWVRFIPHLCRSNFANELFVGIPDKGMRLNLNGAETILVPAHFLHSLAIFNYTILYLKYFFQATSAHLSRHLAESIEKNSARLRILMSI